MPIAVLHAITHARDGHRSDGRDVHQAGWLGNSNVAGVFARHLRGDGVPVFQVSLLPHLEPELIYRLNHDRAAAAAAQLPIRGEIERVLAVVEPRGDRDHRIHFAGDVTDVMANLWAWNDEMETPAGEPWGRRAVQFLVFDPTSRLFAPSKFCAFIPAACPGGSAPPPTMTCAVYASLGERDPRFDGHRARMHLVERLAFRSHVLDELEGALSAFEAWTRRHRDRLRLRTPVTVLLPPSWYTRGSALATSARPVALQR